MSPSDRARARFGRADLLFADPVPRHPRLDGLTEIGRGEYSVVLDMGDGARVMKVVSSPADYFLYTADDRPQGPHFPVVFADHGVIAPTASSRRPAGTWTQSQPGCRSKPWLNSNHLPARIAHRPHAGACTSRM